MESIINALTAAEYTTDAVMERIGEAGQRALNRNSTIASDRAVGQTDDPLATLIRLFILQQPLDVARVAEALPVEDAVTAGFGRPAMETRSARSLTCGPTPVMTARALGSSPISPVVSTRHRPR